VGCHNVPFHSDSNGDANPSLRNIVGWLQLLIWLNAIAKARPGELKSRYGYVNATKWRDVMSYAESCDGCLRIPYWSNPRVLYKGEPVGTLTEDNARVILDQAERVSKFS
jgi:hypothetical protein